MDSTVGGQTLARVDNETVKRVKGVMYAMRTIIEQQAPSANMSKMAYIIIPALADEMCAEMEDLDEMTIRVIMSQIGEIIAWIGHGDNERLPESLREFAEGIQPTPLSSEDMAQNVENLRRFDELTKAENDDEVIEAEIVE